MNTPANSSLAKILLIDDESDLRQVIAKALLKHGFEVLEAADGQEGLRRAAESLPDLILCDLLMPRMNGYEFLAALRRDENLSGIPVIFLTGQSEPAEIRHGMNLGADDYLTKPANLPDLLGAIQARLARRQSERQRQEKQLERAKALFEQRVQDLRKRTAASLPDPRLAGTILLKTMTERRLVKLSDIKAILADGEYCWVYWAQGQKGALLRKSLKQWQSELPAEQFIRVHRRAIINLAFMERIERLSSGRLQIHLREMPEPILVSLSQTSVLNRKLKPLRG
jgi:DNA-binding response OmpR family regulator